MQNSSKTVFVYIEGGKGSAGRGHLSFGLCVLQAQSSLHRGTCLGTG